MEKENLNFINWMGVTVWTSLPKEMMLEAMSALWKKNPMLVAKWAGKELLK